MFAVEWTYEISPGHATCLQTTTVPGFATRKAAERYIRRRKGEFKIIEAGEKPSWGRIAAQLTVGLLLGSAAGSAGPLGGPYGD